MRVRSDGLKRTAWVALLALLIQVLLPSFIHASESQGTIRSEICTAFGVKLVEHKLPDSPSGKQERGHCSICTISDAWILAGNPETPSFLPPVVFSRLFYAQEPALAFSRASLHLRGPPHLA